MNCRKEGSAAWQEPGAAGRRHGAGKGRPVMAGMEPVPPAQTWGGWAEPPEGLGEHPGQWQPKFPIGQEMGGSGSPRLERSPAPAQGQRLGTGPWQTPPSEPVPGPGPWQLQLAACNLCSSIFMPLKHTYKGKTQHNANSGARYPMRGAAIHQALRDKKHERFSINAETKMNINLQSSTKTMGSKESDTTNSPHSIRLGSHFPQTPIANLDLKDKSSCRRALPLSRPSDAST